MLQTPAAQVPGRLAWASLRLFPICPHSHPNRIWEVKVPSRQNWVTIPREQFTMADKLRIWGSQEDQLLWSPVFVDLETQSNAVGG